MAENDLKVIVKAKELAVHSFKLTSNANRFPKMQSGEWVSILQEEGLMMAELKPCPFCGATEEFNGKTDVIALKESTTTPGCWQVICYECLVTSNWYSSKNKAIKAWNRRAGDGK